MSNLLGTTWIFNSQIALPSNTYWTVRKNNNSSLFKTGSSETWYGISVDTQTSSYPGIGYKISSSDGYTTFYDSDNNSWSDDIYKTITFISEPNYYYGITESDFYTWLSSNATKQVELLDIDSAKLLYNDLRSRIVTPTFTNSITIGNTTLTEAQLQRLLEIASVLSVNDIT